MVMIMGQSAQDIGLVLSQGVKGRTLALGESVQDRTLILSQSAKGRTLFAQFFKK